MKEVGTTGSCEEGVRVSSGSKWERERKGRGGGEVARKGKGEGRDEKVEGGEAEVEGYRIDRKIGEGGFC